MEQNRASLFSGLIVQFKEKPQPTPPHGWSAEIPRGRGVLKVKISEAKFEARLEFPRGSRGGGGGGKYKTKTPVGGTMDIFGTAHCISIVYPNRSIDGEPA